LSSLRSNLIVPIIPLCLPLVLPTLLEIYYIDVICVLDVEKRLGKSVLDVLVAMAPDNV
jgi:hypothetical protein